MEQTLSRPYPYQRLKRPNGLRWRITGVVESRNAAGSPTAEDIDAMKGIFHTTASEVVDGADAPTPVAPPPVEKKRGETVEEMQRRRTNDNLRKVFG